MQLLFTKNLFFWRFFKDCDQIKSEMDIDKVCRCCLDDTKTEIYDFTSEFALEDENFLEIKKCFESTLNLTIPEVIYSKLGI